MDDTPASGRSETVVVSRLGRFEIRERLGAGAFGTVYRAYDPQLDREVALKVANVATLDNPQRVERFLREARAAANLRHPHIVPVFDAGSDHARHYIASAFIAGRPLSRSIDKDGVDPRRAARLMRELAEALAYAHGRGIVHRDVKPDNIMIDGEDRVHLMDFGLAARRDDEARITSDGTVMGTPAYMAPEQAAGQQGEAKPAADQYAVGVVLYELLTGGTPFRGTMPAVIHQHINDVPEPPSHHRPGVPRDLETICLKALAKHPEDRYRDCQALADDLRRWLEGEPIAARRERFAERVARWVRRRPTQAGLALLAPIALALLVFSIVAVRLWRSAESARGTAVALQGQAESARDTEKALRRELGEQSAHRQVDLAHRAWRDGSSLRALRLLRDVPPERRGWEWRFLARTCQPHLRSFSTDGIASQVVLTADRRRVFVSGESAIRSWDVIDGRELAGYKGHPAMVRTVALFPDEKRAVSAARDGSVHVWSTADSSLIKALSFDKSDNAPIAVSPDGTWLVIGGINGPIGVWNTATWERVADLKGHTGRPKFLQFLRDGRLLSGADDTTVRVWDVAAAKELRSPVRHRSKVWSAAVSGGEKQLWTGDETGRIYGWNLDDFKPIAEFAGHEDRVWALALSPDGTQLLSGSLDRTARIHELPTGRLLTELRGHTNDVQGVAFLNDGLLLTCGDDTVRVWDPNRAGEARELRGPNGAQMYGLAISPDGQFVAGSFGSGVAAWEAASGQPVPGWPAPKFATALALTFSTDGNSLIGATGGEVWIRNLTGGEARRWKAHNSPVWGCAVQPGGKLLVTLDQSGELRAWDYATGEPRWTSKAHKAGFHATFSADGRFVATTGLDRMAYLWDAATGKQIAEYRGHTHNVNRIAISPDGKRVATASSDNTIRLWDAATGKQEMMLKFTAHYMFGIAFSPDGQRIAASSGDKSITVFDAATGMETVTLRGHSAEVFAVAFSSDGARLVSASLDGTLRLWDSPLDVTIKLPADADKPFVGFEEKH